MPTSPSEYIVGPYDSCFTDKDRNSSPIARQCCEGFQVFLGNQSWPFGREDFRLCLSLCLSYLVQSFDLSPYGFGWPVRFDSINIPETARSRQEVFKEELLRFVTHGITDCKVVISFVGCCRRFFLDNSLLLLSPKITNKAVLS